MSQELTKIPELESDPIDLMPPSDNDVLDYIVMNRQRFVLLLAFPVFSFLMGWQIITGISITISVLTFVASFRGHKKDEKKINGLINEYWKMRLEEFNWLGQF